ncbi:unnamed protein product, partial [Tetraodon nigroviridis]
RPPWVTTTLGCFLIFTIVVDILGNLLVIFSVYRNKKLRNAELLVQEAERPEEGARSWTQPLPAVAASDRRLTNRNRIRQNSKSSFLRPGPLIKTALSLQIS